MPDDAPTQLPTPEQRALLEGADFLHHIIGDQSDEATARARLEVLRTQHPDVRLDLLVDEEPFDGSLHVDLLLRTGTGRTVSISVSPPCGLPWPLRGVVRAGEHDLLEVNGV